ncbi:NADH-quinone oxidoreductase subunit J, partial [Parabacteroides distasonis]
LAALGLVVTVAVMMKNSLLRSAVCVEDKEVPMKEIGTALLGSDKYQYVLPFEFISVFLLACIIGALVVSRKDKEVK